MPPQYVRPYVKTNKHDAADAEAICEAVQRPSMRFVPIKEADQQAALMLHRSRELLVRQRTMLANAVRAHAAEFGLVVPKGIQRLPELCTLIASADPDVLPELAKSVLLTLATQIEAINIRVLAWSDNSWSGIGRAPQVSVWLPSPESARLRLPPSSQLLPMRRDLPLVDSSRPG